MNHSQDVCPICLAGDVRKARAFPKCGHWLHLDCLPPLQNFKSFKCPQCHVQAQQSQYPAAGVESSKVVAIAKHDDHRLMTYDGRWIVKFCSRVQTDSCVSTWSPHTVWLTRVNNDIVHVCEPCYEALHGQPPVLNIGHGPWRLYNNPSVVRSEDEDGFVVANPRQPGRAHASMPSWSCTWCTRAVRSTQEVLVLQCGCFGHAHCARFHTSGSCKCFVSNAHCFPAWKGAVSVRAGIKTLCQNEACPSTFPHSKLFVKVCNGPHTSKALCAACMRQGPWDANPSCANDACTCNVFKVVQVANLGQGRHAMYEVHTH